MSRVSKILLIIILVVLVGAGLVFWKFWPKKDNSSPTATASKTGLFGTMLAFNVNDSKIDGIQNGWSKFSADPTAYSQFKSALEKAYANQSGLISQTGFSVDREIAGLFTWNVIEPQKGTFNWELTDLAAKYAEKANVKFSAAILPYAAWDQKNTQPISGCQALDFAYYDFKAGPPKDTTEYENFLTKMVERYKGNVAAWEIGNEPDSQCSGYQNNPQAYFDLLKISSETIKKADPQAIVLNGGALETDMIEAESVKTFWTKFFELGGGKYLDKFNLHYNTERNGAKPDASVFLEDLTFFNDLMIKNGGAKPIWITEFGTYSGTPTNSGIPSSQVEPPGGGQQPVPDGQQVQGQTSLPTQSENFQTAWYFKNSILAFANNTERIFIDFIGPDNSSIGGSAMFNTEEKARTFLTTLKTINQKLAGFSKVEKIADSQYKFTVNGKTVYALWLGMLPSEISGKVKVTDTKGQEQTMNAAGIKLSADQPIFVEGK